ncbi:MAG: DUF4390 domain-containing protein [Gammaproteobacteria bacterium]|nr:DUF4390 domain-containing protein [Gammaproteobacteria bacterium]
MVFRNVHDITVTAVRLLALCGAGLLCAPVVMADPGRFEVINATARPVANAAGNEAWVVDARVNLELSDAALEALESGVTLRIAFQYEVRSRRRFWIDELVATVQQDFELQYLSLSQRYVVRDVSDDSVNSYATLFSALRYLGQVRDFRFPETLPVSNPEPYTFSMRAVLDWEKLPGPLAVLAFWRGDFSLESDWYRWIPR